MALEQINFEKLYLLYNMRIANKGTIPLIGGIVINGPGRGMAHISATAHALAVALSVTLAVTAALQGGPPAPMPVLVSAPASAVNLKFWLAAVHNYAAVLTPAPASSVALTLALTLAHAHPFLNHIFCGGASAASAEAAAPMLAHIFAVNRVVTVHS